MAVVLVGVGADTEHVEPALQLTADGQFNYIPIPESYPTTEETTYGSWELTHSEGVAADFVDRISSRGSDSEWISDESSIRSHPVHHDPNFEAMTFGDRRGGGGKGSTLIKHFGNGIETDILGFYTGMKKGPDDQDLNRYLYGYMTVETVHDLSSVEGEDYREAIREFPQNAHAKRLAAAGDPKHDDVVIVEGTTPTAKIESPIRISERIDKRPWYRVSEQFATEFSVAGGQKGIGRKFPLVLEMDPNRFVEKVE